ncbi:metal-dependent hydrolase [Altericroceibacterium xinjiangense]|uniref:metal-dependent hydrolase n=1 Tax=Altericroceibacterium xinjiangense TaxID=762261 RepID=UPI000F7DBD2F|nr:metal-dependent hydrolase [Altericroceibacterium xinjiangense]
MDNLTHSLAGALIGQAGLKRRTGLAMPALIIGANLPDIDATCALLGTRSLALRRGLTHGPIAWVILPLALALILYAYDRWQTQQGTRPEERLPVRFSWLFALAFLACLTHPALDWLNSYGIRFLEPFSHRWFYGDVLFIIDVWLWVILGLAAWISRRREKRGGNWPMPARIGLMLALAYIGGNLVISRVDARSTHQNHAFARVVIASPVPVQFWNRQTILGDGTGRWLVDGARYGEVRLASCDLAAVARVDPEAAAFLFWSRAPFVERAGEGWSLRDARFAGSMASDRFSVPLPPGTC